MADRDIVFHQLYHIKYAFWQRLPAAMQVKLGSPPHESGIMDRYKQNAHFPDIRGPVSRGFGFWSCYPGGDVTVSPMRFSKYDPANPNKTKHCPLKQSLFQVYIFGFATCVRVEDLS